MDFLGNILVAIIAAFLGAWLTMRRFRVDRWWEKKAEAYINLVEALHEMSMVPAEQFNAACNGKDLRKEQEVALWESFDRARRRVWKIADSADFVISSDVARVVQVMNNGISQAENAASFPEHLDEIDEAIGQCMAQVKVIGADELGIKKGSGWNGWVPTKIKAHIEDFKYLSKHL